MQKNNKKIQLCSPECSILYIVGQLTNDVEHLKVYNDKVESS